MHKYNLQSLLHVAAFTGNIMFILWLISNAIDEGFKATPVQIAAYISLIGLLLLNSYLLYQKRK